MLDGLTLRARDKPTSPLFQRKKELKRLDSFFHLAQLGKYQHGCLLMWFLLDFIYSSLIDVDSFQTFWLAHTAAN